MYVPRLFLGIDCKDDFGDTPLHWFAQLNAFKNEDEDVSFHKNSNHCPSLF